MNFSRNLNGMNNIIHTDEDYDDEVLDNDIQENIKTLEVLSNEVLSETQPTRLRGRGRGRGKGRGGRGKRRGRGRGRGNAQRSVTENLTDDKHEDDSRVGRTGMPWYMS